MIVSAVSAPKQDDLTADHQAADYNEHNLVLPAGYDISAATLRIVGVYDTANGVDVADGLERISVANDGKLSPGADKQLATGEYTVTVGMTHSGFLGELQLVVSVTINSP